jgi:membrane-associated phospholipid phosphatase
MIGEFSAPVISAAYSFVCAYVIWFDTGGVVGYLAAPLICYTLCFALRRIVGRKRPGDPPGGKRGASFPSNHAAMSATVAVVMGAAHPVFGIVMGIASALTGVSRVLAGKHWPGDVAAGWIIGVGIGVAALAFIGG